MTGRRKRLHIVVTCANRKREAVPSRLQLRRVTGVRTTTRLTSWTERLSDAEINTVSAEDLYAGEHWDVARSLPTCASGFGRVTLWVASAGWGLIRASAKIRPYSATFAGGHPDSVPDGRWGAMEWWDAVATWSGPETGAPRSLSALVAEHPQDRMLLVLSQPYFAACAEDLADAIDASSDGQISIVAAGVTDPDFATWRLPANARLQQRFGGSRGSLNARIAAHLLRAGLIDHEAMRRHLQRVLAKAPAMPVYARRRLTDDQVRTYIRQQRKRDVTLSRSRLLADLRDAGMACEQQRFADLFADATARQL